MRKLRSCLTIFCFGLFGLGGLIIGTILFPLVILCYPSKNNRRILSNIVHYSWILFVKIMIGLRLISVKTNGKCDFKKTRGHVIVANHPTLIDVVLLVSLIPNSVCVVKATLAKNFFIKHLIHRIYLVNDNDPTDFMNKAQEILAMRLNIIIFPEGTRSDNNPRKFYRSFAQIALRSNATILPIRIDCNPLILSKKQKWYDIGIKTAVYHITFYPPHKVVCDPNVPLHHQAKSLSEAIYSKLFQRTN